MITTTVGNSSWTATGDGWVYANYKGQTGGWVEITNTTRNFEDISISDYAYMTNFIPVRKGDKIDIHSGNITSFSVEFISGE